MNAKERSPRGSHGNAALLIIDVQRGLFRKSTPIYRADELLLHINMLADRARRVGAPVFFVQHSDKKMLVRGSDDWNLHPGLHIQAEDHIVPKCHVSAFQDTSLDDQLLANGIRKVVVAGLVTYACVRATCIDAKKHGYQVVLAKDAHSNCNKHASEVIDYWNKKLGSGTAELRATQEIEFVEQEGFQDDD
jgi:nicotinamidase-related amidase